MAISFRIVEHSVRRGVQLVEVLLDGTVVGAIYPKDDGIMIASAHFSEKEFPKEFDGEVVEDNGLGKFPPIPSVSITFKPRKYYIIGNRIEYVE